MLPVYPAVSYVRIISQGGRTKPWLVFVDTPHGIKPYVVKMFRNDEFEREPVLNEVLGNILAREFDLPVPEAALIEMDESFRMSIKDSTALETFDLIDERPKFGSSLIEGNYLFNTSFKKVQTSRMIEIDTLFAFDVLIRNKDRNSYKPNLLVRGNSAFLIDHELGFEIDVNTINQLNALDIINQPFKYHIFYYFLKKARKTTKKDYFEVFLEYLRRLNINTLNPYFQQLNNLGFTSVKENTIRGYLTYAKQNSSKFEAFLKSLIS
jgi:hypothetical protein